MSSIGDMPPEGKKDAHTRSHMQDLARMIDEHLPDRWGFLLIAFPFGDAEGRMNYVANGQREDIIKLMKEFIEKNEKHGRMEGHPDL